MTSQHTVLTNGQVFVCQPVTAYYVGLGLCPFKQFANSFDFTMFYVVEAANTQSDQQYMHS